VVHHWQKTDKGTSKQNEEMTVDWKKMNNAHHIFSKQSVSQSVSQSVLRSSSTKRAQKRFFLLCYCNKEHDSPGIGTDAMVASTVLNGVAGHGRQGLGDSPPNRASRTPSDSAHGGIGTESTETAHLSPPGFSPSQVPPAPPPVSTCVPPLYTTSLFP
jgi:hypothetical protein